MCDIRGRGCPFPRASPLKVFGISISQPKTARFSRLTLRLIFLSRAPETKGGWGRPMFRLTGMDNNVSIMDKSVPTELPRVPREDVEKGVETASWESAVLLLKCKLDRELFCSDKNKNNSKLHDTAKIRDAANLDWERRCWRFCQKIL